MHPTSFLVIFALLPVYHTSSNNTEIVNPHPYNLTLNHPRLCAGAEVDLLLMIVSSPANFQRRQRIRNSWGLIAVQRRVKRLFLLGLPASAETQRAIAAENRLYRDVLQEDFVDSYRNLTLKSMMMVKWAASFCAQARFTLKIDDDVFLNARNLFRAMADVEDADQPLILGLVYSKFKPHRDAKSKYYVSEEEYPEAMYPDFADGPSYLYSRGALPLLYETALRTRPIFLEDVYLNGMVAAKARVGLKNNKFFCVKKALEPCKAFTSVITYHNYTEPNALAMLWWVQNDSRVNYCATKDRKAKRVKKILKRKVLR